MSNLFKFLIPNKKDVFQEYAENMPPLQPIKEELPVIQFEGGPQAGGVKPQRRKLTLTERLLGVQETPTDNITMQTGTPVTAKDEITGENVTYMPQNISTISQNPRVGGLFNDIASGARENFSTGFAAPNLLDNKTSDGRDKGFAYRLGEGLGTLGRFAESPLGRGLITAGIVGATGGNGLTALAYGGQTGALNQKLRYQDRMFRNEMINNAQNSLQNSPEFMMLSDEEKQEALNNVANRVNNMRGYVTNDVYNNFVKAQQLRDNADYRNMMANLQMENNKAMQDFRKDQAEYQRQKDIADRQDRALTRALTARGQNLQYALGMSRLQADAAKVRAAQSAKQENAISTLNQIDLIRGMVAKTPNATGLAKGMVIGDVLNRLDNNSDNIQTRTAIDALRTKIRHDLTGAQFSPKEAREYDKFLPNARDNAQIINAKLDALEKRYMSDFGVSLSEAGTAPKKVGKSLYNNASVNNNPLGLDL